MKFPTGGQSPRAQADLVKFQNRQYSLDDRRYRINKLAHITLLHMYICHAMYCAMLIFHTFQSRFKFFKVVFFISNIDFKGTFLKIILRLFFAYEDRKEDLICIKKMFIHLF